MNKMQLTTPGEEATASLPWPCRPPAVARAWLDREIPDHIHLKQSVLSFIIGATALCGALAGAVGVSANVTPDSIDFRTTIVTDSWPASYHLEDAIQRWQLTAAQEEESSSDALLYSPAADILTQGQA